MTEFKTLEEQLRLIKKDQEPKPVTQDDKDDENKGIIPRPIPLSEFITIAEARQECDRVETLYREQSEEIIERRLKSILQDGVKRKYTIKYRNGMKIVMEQLSL